MPLSWLRLTINWAFDGPMLVAASTPAFHRTDLYRPAGPVGRWEPNEVDATFYVDPDGKPVIPGSSIRGAVRAYCDRIAATIGGDAVGVGRRLFGWVDEDEKDAARGHVRFCDARICGDEDAAKPQNHVAIDRVTNFAAEGRLFSTLGLESPSFSSDVLLLIDAGNRESLRGLVLLLMALRDAQAGLVWMGSRTTRGYGHMHATVTAVRGSLIEGNSRRDFGNEPGTTLWKVAEYFEGATEAWSGLVDPKRGIAGKVTQ